MLRDPTIFSNDRFQLNTIVERIKESVFGADQQRTLTDLWGEEDNHVAFHYEKWCPRFREYLERGQGKSLTPVLL